MGELIWPTNGAIYLDANCFIYSVEKIDLYRTILDTLWKAISDGQVTVITSELTFLEVLVKPLKEKDMYNTFRRVPDLKVMVLNEITLQNKDSI